MTLQPPVPEGNTEAPVVANPRRWGHWGTMLRGLVVLGLVGTLALGALGFGIYTRYSAGIDEAEVMRYKDPAQSTVTQFRASDGQLVGEWFVERRVALRYEELPRPLILAFLAAEDARFFSHHGVDLRGIARAALTNLARGRIAGGGSTITQQLAKLSVGRKKSLFRKVRQTVLARRMEDLLSKEEILTLYVNSIYLGHHSYGVQAAAQNYFRKQIWEINLAECAMIAALAQSPSRKNPIVDMAAARRRMNYVLDQMARWGWATPEAISEARQTELVVYPRADLMGDNTPFATEHARMIIEERYGDPRDETAWLRHGLNVTMHVEPANQAAGRRALDAGLTELAKDQGWPGALANMPSRRFLQRNARWLADTPPQVGDKLVARVTAVSKAAAEVEIGEGVGGVIGLKSSRWMVPYRELPKGLTARKRRNYKVSYKAGRLKDLSQALKEGDIVLVKVAGGQPSSLKLEVVPVPLMEGALIGFDPAGRGVDTAVGGWDFDRSQLQRTLATRQTGSTMKPIIYGKLYDMGVPPSKLFSGAPFVDGKYSTGPRAKDDRILWDALARSENNVSLRALQHILRHTTLKDYEGWGRKLGLPLPLKPNTAYVLGGDQTPMGMAHAWGVFARSGLAPNLSLLKKVVNREGKVLERRISPIDPHSHLGDTLIAVWNEALRPAQRRIAPATAHLIRENLVQAVRRGTGKRAKKLGQPAGGKTGTLAYDVWFNGFTAERVAVAWVGADNRERPLGLSEARNKVNGANTALPIWLDYMQSTLGESKGRPFPRAPSGIVQVRVDPSNGLRARTGGILVPHRAGTEPKLLTPDPESPNNVGVLETEF